MPQMDEKFSLDPKHLQEFARIFRRARVQKKAAPESSRNSFVVGTAPWCILLSDALLTRII